MKILMKIIYWVIQVTWGVFMTVLGFFATIFSLIFLQGKIHKNGYGFITEVKGNWGGVSLGAFALCGSYSQVDSPCYDPEWYEHTRRHEFGHSLQNCILGLFFPFVVAIPSAVRYWLYRYGKLTSEYESIWFERTATRWGAIWVDRIENTSIE